MPDPRHLADSFLHSFTHSGIYRATTHVLRVLDDVELDRSTLPWTRLPTVGGGHENEASHRCPGRTSHSGHHGRTSPCRRRGLLRRGGPADLSLCKRPGRMSMAGPRKILETLKRKLQAGDLFLEARSTCVPWLTCRKPGAGLRQAAEAQRGPGPGPAGPPPSERQIPAGPRKARNGSVSRLIYI